MPRRKEPPAPPPPRDPFEAWGDVPSDHRAERKRLARLIAADGRGIVDYKAFCRALGAACHEANAALYERSRHDRAAVAAGLADLGEKLAAAREALAALGADAAAALDAAVASEGRDSPEGSPWPHLEPRGLDLFTPTWEERAAWLDRALADCGRWAALARTGIDTPRPGRPADDVARMLVRRLGEIWSTQAGQAPTLITDPYTLEKRGDFLNFCEQVIAPIWRGRGFTPPAVVAFVREYCYPPR